MGRRRRIFPIPPPKAAPNISPTPDAVPGDPRGGGSKFSFRRGEICREIYAGSKPWTLASAADSPRGPTGEPPLFTAPGCPTHQFQHQPPPGLNKPLMLQGLSLRPNSKRVPVSGSFHLYPLWTERMLLRAWEGSPPGTISKARDPSSPTWQAWGVRVCFWAPSSLWSCR